MRKFKVTVVTLFSCVSMLIMPLSAYAYNGNLTFTHGNNYSEETTGGKISSSATENSMCIDVGIRYDSDSAPTTMYPGNTEYNTDYIEHYEDVSGRKGYSYCYYKVDDELVKLSKKWFAFDFTLF